MEGSIYSVDEVSDLLGIPRPTLYRYLREYSIPHLRQGGRIQIPEDSFDRIREARDLHKEGLGTDSVRRQLREGGPDTGELDRRLTSLHDTLEDLRGELRERPATSEVALSPTLRTVLARQSLMLSAMFNLTGMVEDLLLANGRPRKRTFEDLEDEPDHTVLLPAEGRAGIPGALLVEAPPVRAPETTKGVPPAAIPAHARPARFGSLGRRRRQGLLALLASFVLGLLLALLLPTLLAADGTETANTSPSNDAPAGVAAGQADNQRPEDAAPKGATQQATAGEDEAATTTEANPPSDGALSEETNVRSATAPDPSGGVPEVSGRGLEEAARAVTEAGFSVAAIRTEASPEAPDTVLKTEPSAGTDARPGAPVVLTTSAGPTSVSAASAAASAASSSSSASTSASASSVSTASAGASASASPSP